MNYIFFIRKIVKTGEFFTIYTYLGIFVEFPLGNFKSLIDVCPVIQKDLTGEEVGQLLFGN